jgi:hypothetical protein
MLFYHKIIPNIICQPVLSFAGNILLNKIISKTYNPQRFRKTSELFRLKSITLSWSNQYSNVTEYYINCIRGNDVNDIVAVGAFGEVHHYNGKRWKSFKTETGLNGTYHSVAIKGNLIVAVGFEEQQAVILVGKR